MRSSLTMFINSSLIIGINRIYQRFSEFRWEKWCFSCEKDEPHLNDLYYWMEWNEVQIELQKKKESSIMFFICLPIAVYIEYSKLRIDDLIISAMKHFFYWQNWWCVVKLLKENNFIIYIIRIVAKQRFINSWIEKKLSVEMFSFFYILLRNNDF